MLHSPEDTPLSDFVGLDQRTQAHVLHALQELSVAGDNAANVRLLFAEALQVVASLSPAGSSSSASSASQNNVEAHSSAENHEETTSSYLNAIMLFNAAFEAAESSEMPESMVDDYIFVRAVVQAAISLRIAGDVERDLRQFAKSRERVIRPRHFNAIMTRAFDAVRPPNDEYWSQLEHVQAAADAPIEEANAGQQ